MAQKMDSLTYERDRSGFWLQLRVLLWKNFTLKKRRPIVFLVEILLPLTLFILLLLIRHNQHVVHVPERTYAPKPLPSAGLLPALLSFCDKEHILDQENERLSHFLSQFSAVMDLHWPALSSNMSMATSEELLDNVRQLETMFPELSKLHTDLPSDQPRNTSLSDPYTRFVKGWKLIEPLLCQRSVIPTTSASVNITRADVVNEGTVSNRQLKDLRILTNLLYHRPKILFAPNNTIVSKIIKHINASTFELYANISGYAREWLKRSPEMRMILPMLDPVTDLNPMLDVLDHVAQLWLDVISDVNLDVFWGFRSEAELESYFLNKQFEDGVTVFAGLVFPGMNDSTSSLPPHVFYKIRQNATLTPPTNQVRMPFWYPSPGSNNLQYYTYGFVWLQDLVERSIVDLQTGRPVASPGTYIKRMPYPCWNLDGFVWLIQHVLPLCLMLSWVYSVATLVQRIVYEKEKRLKEVMKMMGLTNGVHWCAWFITAALQMTTVVIALTLILHFGRILPYSNTFIVFIFLELFAISSITFAFMISSLFSKAHLASACAGIFYFISYVPYIYLAVREDVTGTKIPATIKTASSVFNTAALGLGGKYLLFYELQGTGIQWENLMVSPRENDKFSLFIVLLMMCFDTFLYSLITWYVENIHPGTYGIPRPWYFPFSRSYWCPNSTGSWSCSLKQMLGIRDMSLYADMLDDDVYYEDVDFTTDTPTGSKFEPASSDLPVGVKISNLRKVYDSTKKVAIDGVNLTLYEGHITSFLGHNGAGKTTTMSILTGLFPPTSGTAHIYGLDIRKDMDEIRQSLGICPQHNVLFDLLTVDEHLWFFARLKGMKNEDIQRESNRVLKDVGLTRKRNTMSMCLSGGMQRKLSVAMAFVGGARTVILDEPTAGVDPYSRRSIWNLLTKYKSGRTILLSTHHMDEAERLGDRIAIISNGQIKCSGSPIYLKSVLGEGHHLHILKQKLSGRNDSAIEEEDMTNEILDRIRLHVPSVIVQSKTEEELRILLPIGHDKRDVVIDVIEMLERNKDELGIISFGMKDGGFDEVFVKVTEDTINNEFGGQDHTKGDPSSRRQKWMTEFDMYDDGMDNELRSVNNSESNMTNYSMNIDDTEEVQIVRKLTGFPKLWLHFKALMVLRFRYVSRNRKGLFSQIILPAIFVSIAMTIALSAPRVDDPSPLTLSPSMFYNLTRPKGNFIPYSVKRNNIDTDTAASCNPSRLKDTFLMASGIGATCVLKSNYMFTFQSKVLRNGSSNNWQLVSKYFEDSCQDVFTAGTQSELYVPPTDVKPVIKSKPVSRSTANMTGTQSLQPLYPECSCKKDNVGFHCSYDDVTDPVSSSVTTGDILQDITATYEDDFYLYTTDKYRLHRYGGFTFGNEIPFVPSNFSSHSSNSKIADSLIVKQITQVWFNQKGFHSIPSYVNTLNNAILRANLPSNKGNPAAYGITAINHPMKRTNTFMESEYIKSGSDVLMAIFIIVAMAFVPASFVVFVVHERAINAKHQQMISGLNPVIFWITNYIWDMCNYMIPAVCIVVILLCFHIPAYVAKGNLEAVVALFLLYGWSVTPMMYPASFLFKEPSVAFIVLIMVNLFTGITCVVTTFILELFSGDPFLAHVNSVLKEAFLVFPNYCLGSGLMDIAMNHYKNEFAAHLGQYDKIVSALDWHVSTRKLVIMSITGMVFFFITLKCEYRRCGCKRKTKTDLQLRSRPVKDNDVIAEQQRTLYGSGRHDVIRLEKLTKVYKKRGENKLVAVDGLTFAVPRGQCFGLLGVNGAGKTSTFKMLTGNIAVSGGDAHISQHSIRNDAGGALSQLGYCPQFDALFDDLTPREHLQLYARLRGIHPGDQNRVIESGIKRLGLTSYRDIPAGYLSGGNKRKLSTAISLIGDPPVIFMDEPTSGMDPYSRRFLWRVIEDLTREGRSVLLTSHSMDECEMLCSRLAIMVNGQMKCLGSIQHLKGKYGGAYTLTVNFRSAAVAQLALQYILDRVPRCEVKDQSHTLLVFEVKVTSSQLAEVYRSMEKAMTELDIAEYSLSQDSLDNVFIKFAKEQSEVVQYLRDEDSSSTSTSDSDPSLEHASGVTSPSTIYKMADDDDEPLIELVNRTVSSSEGQSDDELIHI